MIGPYKIVALLGRGGMGEVYLAEDAQLDRKIALKFLSSKYVDDAWANRQLIKEAQAVARLDHPNICAVLSLEHYDGHTFIMMQYIKGDTLASLIKTKRLEAKQVSPLAKQIVSAIENAHSHGVIHRDIKPQNIMVTADGEVKVLDFGLAKLVQQKQGALSAREANSQSSQLGLVIGTVSYMSPEQLRGERLDFRSDIFSFGIVLYEMISGKNPYARDSNAETISAILSSEPPLMRISADIPQGLAQIAQKCLMKDKERRYLSASELLIDMDKPCEESNPALNWRERFMLSAFAAFILLLLIIVAAAILFPSAT
jgi:serine/threonine protein kinase